MGDGTTDFGQSNYTSSALDGGTIQSLPDLTNPCQRIWDRYFAPNTTHITWFGTQHNVDHDQMIVDCNQQVSNWHLHAIQIRYGQHYRYHKLLTKIRMYRIIRNVTTPLSSHTIQALFPSNLESMRDAFHISNNQSPGYPGTLKAPIHYDGQTPNNTFWYKDPGFHVYHNPASGSLLTKAAKWPASVAAELGVQDPPAFQLKDSAWWDDMDWYADNNLNRTVPPCNKTRISKRYWDWDARYPSTYPAYETPWPSSDWNSAQWPAHLYGTLPSSWGTVLSSTGKAMLHNLRVM